MTRFTVAGTIALTLASAWVAEGQATQPRSRDCDTQFDGVKVGGVITTHFQSYSTSAGHSNLFVGGGVNGYCRNSDQKVLADSAEHYGDTRVLILIGRVRYIEKRMQLDADTITYYMGEERLVAKGHVVGRTSTGTRFTGPSAVYLRAKQGLRDRSRLDAGGRPDTWISGSDAGSATDKPDSVHVLADSLISDNDSLVYALGKVIIERPDLIATGDSAMMDQGREIASLRLSPKVVGRGEKSFALSGHAIDIYSRNRQAERVRSAGAAKATSDAVQLDADTIVLQVTDQQLSNATAWGPKGARAAQSGRDITADSIDVAMPRQILRAIHAVHHAKVATLADSLNVRSRERDWFAGDTIIAEFDSVATRDTSSATRIRSLVAKGSARSWQQSARSGVPVPDSTPAINYITGRMITVSFAEDRSLDRLSVLDQVTGLLVQPSADTTRAKPAPKKPGSGGTRRDSR
ncbi:MAG: hypothetical protein CK531_01125 [Gemmatimonadetes bacterium]|nr:MAG: hypothetical protein CK531_01125 [Gemmatimonadota bacterium]